MNNITDAVFLEQVQDAGSAPIVPDRSLATKCHTAPLTPLFSMLEQYIEER